MKEGDPISQRMNALPFIVRDYLEIGQDIEHAHDQQQKEELSRSRLDLIGDISSDPEKLHALTEFVIFRDNHLKEVKKHEGNGKL